jgi:hypothetical protein
MSGEQFQSYYTMINNNNGGKNGQTLDLTESLTASMHQCTTELAKIFFSPRNMNAIQTNLRIVVKEKTGYVIGRQNDEQVAIVMRAMYALHARHGDPIDKELHRLNAIVLSELAPMVGTGISQYLGYIRDASQMHVPLERPKNMSIKGSNTFELFKGL